MITRILSVLSGYLFAAPFVGVALALIPFHGRKIALQISGRLLTKAAGLAMSTLVPKWTKGDSFADFKTKLKHNFGLAGPLYDLILHEESNERIEFRVRYCPVAEALRRMGFTELCRYSCAGDYVVAKKNLMHWDFERDCTIGTGGGYCNPAYCRKREGIAV